MNRQAMREKVLGEMVVARDLEIERLNAALAAVKQLNRHQGEKILELLEGQDIPSNVHYVDGQAFIGSIPVALGEIRIDSRIISSGFVECQ